MRINFEGREWDFDEDEIDVKQATVLYLTYQMTIEDWIRGITHVDQRSLHFTYWLMLQQNGVIKPIADCNPKIVAFGAAYGNAREEEAKAEAAKKAAEAQAAVPVVPTIPSPPGGPLSPVPAIPTDTTPGPPGQPPVQVPIGY